MKPSQHSPQTVMWHTYPPQYCTEPKELRLLKDRLARVTCNCNACQRTSDYPYGHGRPSDTLFKYTKDIETQYEALVSANMKTMHAQSTVRDALCPTCSMTLNLLRGGVIRVLKDEESETQTSMFSSDKSTEKEIISCQRASALKNPTVSPVSALSDKCSFSSCDFVTDTQSDVTVRNTFNNSHSFTKRNTEKVKFRDLPSKPQARHDCVCIQDFMDSIRPPLNHPPFR